MNKNNGFTSWRDSSLIIGLKFSDARDRDTSLLKLTTSYPNLKVEIKPHNRVKLTAENAAQVWFIKQLAQNLEIKVVA